MHLAVTPLIVDFACRSTNICMGLCNYWFIVPATVGLRHGLLVVVAVWLLFVGFAVFCFLFVFVFSVLIYARESS